MKGSLTATTLTAPCSTLQMSLDELRYRDKEYRRVGHIRIAEDDTSDATEPVDTNESFRHGDDIGESV